ncbi:MAG: hypothetical protein LBB63_00995 [Holosporaceae bacterium]|jgi:hypothetical protein|nr:hypothetical protein [Holosporaceae bacterium]
MGKKILFLLLCLSLSSCCQWFGGDLDAIAERQTCKLRRHFRGDNSTDVSTLIRETMAVSRKLKSAGMLEEANKFDSYTDVLMYGNNTIDESINDVLELVRQRECTCSTMQGFTTRLCGR